MVEDVLDTDRPAEPEAAGESDGPADEISDHRGPADGTRARRAETFGVTCPCCGGSLRMHEGQRSIRCEYCCRALYVTRAPGVRSFIMEARISAGRAKLSALRDLSKRTGGRVKARHASVVDVRLIHVPFWRMHGRLMGWISGSRSNRREVEIVTPGPDGPTVRQTIQEEQVPFTKLVFKRVDWSTPACAFASLGLQGISLRANFLNWDLFDHRLETSHNIALPMESLRQASRDAYTYLTRLTAPAGSRVSASRFHLFDDAFSLYYYPVYIIRYRHGERIYTMTIDGNSGHVIRSEVPPGERTNLRSMFFVPAAFAFLAQTYLPLAFVAAVALYVYDGFQTEGFLSPYRWVVNRLNGWFGGEVRYE